MANKLKDFNFSNLEKYPNVGIVDPKKKSIGKLNYGRNHKIRSHTQKIAMTPEAIEEKNFCFENPIYMYEKYFKLFQVGKGFLNISLWDHQKEYLKYLDNEKLLLALFARRLAKSTTAYMHFIRKIISKDDYHVGIAVNDDPLKKATAKTVQKIYEELPPFLQRGVVKWNTNEIVLDNGSSIEFSLINGDTFRGQAKDFIMADELDFADFANDFFDSVDPIISESPEVQFLITTTPNGRHVMYKLWSESERGKNDFKRLKYIWSARPDRDEEWFQNELQKKGQLYCNRNHLCSFDGSSLTLIKSSKLRELEEKIETPIDEIIGVKIYEELIKSPQIKYVIGVDTSKISSTSGNDPDSISFHIIKVDLLNLRFKQVASYKTEDIHYTETSDIIMEIAELYEDSDGEMPLVMIENNEGSGQSIADTLYAKEYPNVYAEPRRDDINGFRTTRKTKDIGLKNLKYLIENDILEVIDDETIDQLNKFIKYKTSYQAQKGEHDDTVMSLLAAFFWLLDEDNEFEITIDDIKESISKVIEDVEIEEESADVMMKSSSNVDYDSKWLMS